MFSVFSIIALSKAIFEKGCTGQSLDYAARSIMWNKGLDYKCGTNEILDNTTISGWETGKDTIPLEKLVRYANEFNLSLDYLFGIISRNENKG